MVQGYEVQVLKALEKRIKRITTEMEDMPEIRYKGRHWRRRYYPDAILELISGVFLLLEVKSPFTLRKGGVLAKAKAAFAFCSEYSNLNYRIAVYTPKKPILWLKSMKELVAARKAF